MSYRTVCNYDKFPTLEMPVSAPCVWQGYDAIFGRLRWHIASLNRPRTVVALDCYPGVYDDEVLPAFQAGLRPVRTFNVRDAARSVGDINRMLERSLTDDRVFGVLSCRKIEEFFDPDKMRAMQLAIAEAPEGIVLVYGTGASLFAEPDLLLYADLARWEIQLRYRRNEIANWFCDNYTEEILRKYKRGFFIDWRVNDRHKKDIFERINYILDTNRKGDPKLLTGEAERDALRRAARRPFRVVPYFDPGVWGGQWMKDVCGLDHDAKNFAWAFDCVPEENSLLLKFGQILVELPSINLVFYQPRELLGDRVYARFGTEFPIRFDFLDTMEGQNLSLQVHPLTEYIQENFGMHYTQDESYYILDARADADPAVFLGLREGVSPSEMIADLEQAQQTAKFDALKYVNRIPAKKHDHFLIPAGTIHCSGANTMVLEISATPYIFTFKLWDWDRLGLDGRPRPVHIEHGKKNIQFDRTTQWIYSNCVNRVEKVSEGDGFVEERTGLHEWEFIETRRHWFTKPVLHHTGGSVNVLNLVEGDEAVVESPAGAFDPYVVHYAETFIVPDAVEDYTIRPYGKSKGKRLATIKAYVRV